MRGLAKLRDLYISIHAAREGGDDIGALFSLFFSYFNPRRP